MKDPPTLALEPSCRAPIKISFTQRPVKLVEDNIIGIWIKKRLLSVQAHRFDQSHYDKLNADLSCFLLQKNPDPFVPFTRNRTGNASKVIQLDFDSHTKTLQLHFMLLGLSSRVFEEELGISITSQQYI